MTQHPAHTPGQPVAQAELDEVLAQLRAHAGQGFERYKTSTVRRRVERRMGLHGLRDLPSYAQLLRTQPAEAQMLFGEMLIGVTSFFRDPPLWRALQQLLPQLPRRAPPHDTLRAWCIGCSTGEEPYSLAMTWLDAHEAATPPRRLQIFATDLNAGAVARARLGSYSLDRLEGVSAAQRARWFHIAGNRARVSRELRDMVLFARHDITADPPFGRLDLLVCRNLLVYLQAGQQRALMRLFHQCLRPGGWLVLGQSETVGSADALFQALDGQACIYRRHEAPPSASLLRAADLPRPGPLLRDTAAMNDSDARADGPQRRAERLVLQQFAPASVLVNRDGDMLWTCGPTARWLEPADGRTNLNLHAQARAPLRAWLATALRELPSGSAQGVELRGLPLGASGSDGAVDISVLPFDGGPALPGLSLVVFRDAARSGPGGGGGSDGDAAAPGSAAEVQALRLSLQRLQQQLQDSGEDYQSANEELQASNEELSTSREELQSMNEELQSINAELQAKLDALALEQSDMKNLLDSTQIATLFLDERLNVRRFTEQARALINLRDGDVGRPLADLNTRLQQVDLVAQAAQVLRTLRPWEEEVASADGRWFAVRILPYRTVADVIAGVVITLTESTRSDGAQRARPAQPPG